MVIEGKALHTKQMEITSVLNSPYLGDVSPPPSGGSRLRKTE
jgi:hypothetical protein